MRKPKSTHKLVFLVAHKCCVFHSSQRVSFEQYVEVLVVAVESFHGFIPLTGQSMAKRASHRTQPDKCERKLSNFMEKHGKWYNELDQHNLGRKPTAPPILFIFNQYTTIYDRYEAYSLRVSSSSTLLTFFPFRLLYSLYTGSGSSYTFPLLPVAR